MSWRSWRGFVECSNLGLFYGGGGGGVAESFWEFRLVRFILISVVFRLF